MRTPLKTAMASLAPSSNITIIMIIIITTIIINYIIIMIILWLKLYYFFYHWSWTSFARQFAREELNRGANTTLVAWLDIVAWGFWERQTSPFFNVRVCHLNADTCRDLDPDQIFRQHTKQRRSASTLVECFSTTGGMAVECKWYHNRLAKLYATKKGKSYATTITFLHCANYDCMEPHSYSE